MKKEFPEFYTLNKEEIKALWGECIFTFDANVLLNLYRYSFETSENLTKILKELSDRIWVPHQFASEYQRNRMGVIEEQKLKYDKSVNTIIEELNNVETLLGNYYKEIPFDIESIKNDLIKSQESYPNCNSQDLMRDEIDALFDGKVGVPFDEKTLLSVCEDGKERYQNEIPPGYCDAKDKDKDDPTKIKKFGDLVGWKQILEKSKKDKKPIILITSERKEDWWQKVKGKIVGPRYELIREFKNETGQSFYMYDMERFLQHAKEDYTVDDKTINEVIKVEQVYNEPVSGRVDYLFTHSSDVQTPDEIAEIESFNVWKAVDIPTVEKELAQPLTVQSNEDDSALTSGT